ncbi:MAG: pseudouridine synthase [Desulfatiglandales bacterium]
MGERGIRLNKFIRDAGICSRREADRLILEGRVKVNGIPVRELGLRVIPQRDLVEVDQRPISLIKRRIYGILNKPFGVVSSLKDPEGRPCAGDLLKPLGVRVFFVGRLDFDTMGLLPFTNDGQWAQRLLHPKYHVPRTYKAIVRGDLSEEAVSTLRRGVPLSDGPTRGAKLKVLKRAEGVTEIRITIYEGRNRQVRRMFEAVGYEVIHLIRTGFGRLQLGDLRVGEYRVLEDPYL